MSAVPLNPGIINTDMLQSFFGADANSAEDPKRWAEKVMPFCLGLIASDNERFLSVQRFCSLKYKSENEHFGASKR